MDRIYLSSPDVTEAEEAALVRAIRSGWVAPLGPEVDAFERELAGYTGRAHAVALSSGTAALHLGLIVLGVQPGDLVVTSTMTFAATAHAITYVGAEPVFVDCDETGNLDPDLLRKAVADLGGDRVGAVIPVDLLGKVADAQSINVIVAEAGVPVLWDAAESLGATRDGRPAGSFGAAAAVSFNGNKVMTTSGGGALLTDDGDLAARVRYLATQARQPVVHYEHTEIGYNYRLSNLLAALGRAQLGRLDSMIERRCALRERYRALFADVPGVAIFGEPLAEEPRSGVSKPLTETLAEEPRSGVSKPKPATHDNYWLSSILIDPNKAGFSSEGLRLHLAAHDVEARPLWKPMHLQPVFADARSYLNGTSERLFETGLSLPSGSVLGESQIERVVGCIADFLAGRRG
ncbi:DegT/DnrJ/EryC1/StrS family aminotransferase [Granulicoccus sp. GXG6511]|uniref:DegT/DnrJ/EryC1/StrS family aminotransferase n=1 Tax=Granulicoccus sp. GXG6511 TaxID=3381351 RepID=UPI003D7CC3E1